MNLRVKSRVSSSKWVPFVQRSWNRVSINRKNKIDKRRLDATLEYGCLTFDALNFIHCSGEVLKRQPFPTFIRLTVSNPFEEKMERGGPYTTAIVLLLCNKKEKLVIHLCSMFGNNKLPWSLDS